MTIPILTKISIIKSAISLLPHHLSRPDEKIHFYDHLNSPLAALTCGEPYPKRRKVHVFYIIPGRGFYNSDMGHAVVWPKNYYIARLRLTVYFYILELSECLKF